MAPFARSRMEPASPFVLAFRVPGTPLPIVEGAAIAIGGGFLVGAGGYGLVAAGTAAAPVVAETAASVSTSAKVAAASIFGAAAADGDPTNEARAAANAASASSGKVKEAVKQIVDWLGPDAQLRYNKNGDPLVLSSDFTKQIRFDFLNYSPHDAPHVHIIEGATNVRFFGN